MDATGRDDQVAVMDAPPPSFAPERRRQPAPGLHDGYSANAHDGKEEPRRRADAPMSVPSGASNRLWLTVVALVVALVMVGGVSAWWFFNSGVQVSAERAGSTRPAPVPTDSPEATTPEQKPAGFLPVAPSPDPAAADKEAERKRKKVEDPERSKAEKEAPPARRPAESSAPARTESAPATRPQTKPVSTQEQVAQCQKQNLFQREICMFKVCHGKWGRDGCPAYSQDRQQEY